MTTTEVSVDVAPGMHADLDERTYHALPGLSSTGVKRMLEAPALYRWYADHPQPPRSAFDVGHAVHARVLGVGLDVAVIPDELLGANGATSTKAARQFIAEARETGQVPLKSGEYAEVQAMAEAVLAHPDAGVLLAGAQPEVSLIWDDPYTGVRCRGRLDYWHERANLAVDLKTARSADPARFARHAVQYGYAEQGAHYQNGTVEVTDHASTAAGVPRFLHVLVEKEPPYLVSVVELDHAFLTVGAERVRRAINLYAQCVATETWPGYPAGINRITAPGWYRADTDTHNLDEEF